MLKIYDPVDYNLEENKFFRDHLGEPPIAVLSEPLPPTVNPKAVKEVLGSIYDLTELAKHKGTTWCGIEPVKEAIDIYLREWVKWKEMSLRGAPRFPSLFTWDAKGRPHRYGTGSDAGKVTTWIDDEGQRHRLAVDLVHVRVEEYIPKWIKPQVEIPTEFTDNKEQSRLECPLCNWTTAYDPERRSTRNLARTRAIKHCKSPKTEKELHHEFATVAFGG